MVQPFPSLTNSDNVTWYPRVVAGWPALRGDVPYQVALKVLVSSKEREYETFCGAVIVGPNKLLTAAHCFHRTYRKQAQNQWTAQTGRVTRNMLRYRFAVAGNLKNTAKFNRTDSKENGQWRKIDNVFYPKNYKFPNHDIAVAFNKYVGPIPMASRHIEYSGTCLVSGYGRVDFNMTSASSLLLANLDVIPTHECSQLHQRSMKDFVCSTTKLSDVGKGDSGGPLVCSHTDDPNEGDHGILVGIVSGFRTNRGPFFTRVSRYKEFIKQVRVLNETSHNEIVVKKLHKNNARLFYSTPIHLYFITCAIAIIAGAYM
ncbi:kallikrein 1-related peptidase b9-like [Anticarsia gemmatalis]|uniref:kallikrein 1-related peptidase b9-like n=1 Tax=Anticarsia gemmatalis TaxID=129554 RepID=UPI003F774F59